MPGIVAGVDGSGHSRKALERAVNEAAVRHAPLNRHARCPVIIIPATGI